MKTKRLLLAVASLFLFLCYIQPPSFAQMMFHSVMEQAANNDTKTHVRANWNGCDATLTTSVWMYYPEIRTALGISDEQWQQIQHIDYQIGRVIMPSNSEFLGLMDEMNALGPIPSWDTDTEEAYLDIRGRMESLRMSVMTDTIGDLLTSEQKRQIRELQLVCATETPSFLFSPSMFEALNLTDDQKEQVEGIKKELEPEFEKELEKFVDGQRMARNLTSRMMVELNLHFDQSPEARQIASEKLMEDPESRKIIEGIQSQGVAFALKFKTRMFDVLTVEQRARWQELLDNPPKHVRIYLESLREQRGETEENVSNRVGDVWMPGPGSWRPGDPLPESYRQQRNERRFPRPQ